MGRITVDGKIAQFSLKEDVHPDCWDAKSERTTGKTREQTDLNSKIKQTEQSIRDIYQRTVDTGGFVTAEQIKNELTGVAKKTENLLQLFREHNAEYEKRVGIDREYGSFYTYKNAYQHLQGFIRSKYELEDFPLKQLDMSFINDYDFYLRVNVRFHISWIVRQIHILKKMISRAMNHKIIQHDPFPDYVCDKLEKKYQHLSKQELKKIMSAKIHCNATKFIRDMFVFSCFTGLAYADVRQLSEKHLRKTPDGSIWIDIPRSKTDVESNIRLLEIPIKIIEKYRSERKSDLLFNMPRSCTISNCMRKIEELCGITHLHFHMARHTFATQICLSNGVSMEALSKMMGHSSIRSTQIYGEITHQKVGEDMKKLAARIQSKGKYKIE